MNRILYRFSGVDQFRDVEDVAKVNAKRARDRAQQIYKAKKEEEEEEEALLAPQGISRNASLHALMRQHLSSECRKHGDGFFFILRCRLHPDSSFRMHIASLEDSLQAPLGKPTQGLSVMKLAMPRHALQQDAAMEEAFNEFPLDVQDEQHDLEQPPGEEAPATPVGHMDVQEHLDNAASDVYFKVAHTPVGSMRLPALPIASGRRVGMEDVIVSVHAKANHIGDGVLLSAEPSHVFGQHTFHFGILSLSDQNANSLRVHSQVWKYADPKFSLHSMVGLEDLVDIVTFLVRSAALTHHDGSTTPVSIAIHNDTQRQRDQLRHLASLRPDLLECTKAFFLLK